MFCHPLDRKQIFFSLASHKGAEQDVRQGYIPLCTFMCSHLYFMRAIFTQWII